MKKPRVLIVEDEADILELLVYTLEREQFVCKGVKNGENALKEVDRQLPDLVMLDLMLPGIDGLSICRTLKQSPRTAHIPIVMLTARGEESDIVVGLELGADDYITKPFSAKVLPARLRAVLRRRREEKRDENSVLSVQGLTIDPRRHEVRLNGQSIDLTGTEFRLLHFLARHAGWVFTRDQIVDAVHGADYAVTDRSVDVQVVGLRRKLGTAGSDTVETVRGVGYRFKE